MADFTKGCYKEKFVKDLGFSDFRVAVSGVIVSAKDSGFLLGDGSGEVYINLNGMDKQPVIKDNSTVRVFGRLVPYENGFEIHGEIVQDLTGIDMGALKKIKEILTSL